MFLTVVLICFTDLQNVNITLRILFRPQPQVLPKMYMNLGEDYDERVLPSITNEILKAVVVCTCTLYVYVSDSFCGTWFPVIVKPFHFESLAVSKYDFLSMTFESK